MRDLAVAGLSDDGDFVICLSDTDEEFRIPVEESLRQALRSTRTTEGQVAKKMDSAMRPKDIQARIRGGESPETVAAIADVPVDKIMGYAVPVLAEREHMCERARRSPVRRKHTSGPGRLLGDAVDDHLRSANIDPTSSDWDSWRREDGRWTITVSTLDGGAAATYLFDLPGRYVIAVDDAARVLIDDVAPTPDPTDMAIAAAVAEAELLGGTSIPPDATPVEDHSSTSAEVTPIRRRRGLRRRVDQQLTLDDAESDDPMIEGPEAVEPTVDLTETADRVRSAGDDDIDAVARATSDEPDDRPTPKKRRGNRRTSVPSWDEIMFGGSKRDE